MCADIASASDALFGVKFWADFAKEAFAAIAGAGVGAWLGAKYAFALERSKARAEHAEAERAEGRRLADQRQVAGNLALFTLAQMRNEMVTYKRQTYDEAMKADARWFRMPATSVIGGSFLRFDLPSIAFLLQSQEKDGPLMPMKLAVEQDRYAAFLETVRIRGEYHQEQLARVSERVPDFASMRLTDEELRKLLGDTCYLTLRNYHSDIGEYLKRNLETSEELLKELRSLLQKELPGRAIVGYEDAPIEEGSPIMKARNRTEPPQPPARA
jgi:hypothetical protein